MPVSCAPIQSAPAVATSPRIARTSGIPAAASEPKAMARTASVTGQESTSERSIAALFSSLNSDHNAAEPVSDTSMPGPAAASSRSRRRLAARTISAVPAAAPPRTTATRPSGAIAGDGTAPTAGSRRSRPATRPTVARKRRARTVVRARADDREQRIAALTVEVPIDQTAGLHGLRAIGLPAAPGQRMLGARSEYAEDDGDDDPGEQRPCGGGWPPSGRGAPAGRAPVRRSGGCHEVSGRAGAWRQRTGRPAARREAFAPTSRDQSTSPWRIA